MKVPLYGLLSALKYLLALYMMYAGVTTIADPQVFDSDLVIIFENRVIITTFGVIFFVSGAILFFAKLFKQMWAVGVGLFLIYTCFLMASILVLIGFGFVDALGNIIVATIVAALYLRWRRMYREQKVLDKRGLEVLDSPLSD